MAGSSVRARPGPSADQRVHQPGWRERRAGRLERDVARVEKIGGWINRGVWGIALGVMVYGAINVTPLLIEHGVLWWSAPGLPLMVDLAMCIGLLGDRIMHQYGRRAPWVTALRWITAAMTLALNIAGPVLGLDWVGLGIHACGPLLILVVAEAAGSFQRLFAEIVAELQADIDRQLDPGAAGPGVALGSATVDADPGAGSAAPSAAANLAPRHEMRDQSRDAPARVSRLLDADGHVSDSETDPLAAVVSARDLASSGDNPSAAGQIGITAGRDQRDGTATRHEPDETAGRDQRDETATRHEPDKTAGRDQQNETATRHEPDETAGRDQRDETSRARVGRDGATPRRRGAVGVVSRNVAAPARRETLVRDGEVLGVDHEAEGDTQSKMWAHFEACRAVGTPVSAADLDRLFGTNGYARRLVRMWIEQGRITEQDREDARVGRIAPDAVRATDERGGQANPAEPPWNESIAVGAGAGGAG